MLITSAAVVIIALIALVALPLLVASRIDRLRHQIDARAQPARNDLNEVNYQLSRQIASLSRHVLTGGTEYVEEYRHAAAAQDQAMQSLRGHVGALGPDSVARFAVLDAEVRQWHSLVNRYLNAVNASPGAAANHTGYEANYPLVIEAVYRLDESISAFQSAIRVEAGRWTRWLVAIATPLVVLALVAAAIVIWMVARLGTLASDLSRESDERMRALHAEREMLRSRDEILGIVSHDLRSPLTTITLSAQLLQGSSPEEQAEQVETILTTTRRMQRLIQDLLDATKIENSSLSIRHDVVEPDSVAKEVAASQAAIAEQKHIRFETAIGSPLPKISGDHDRLVQALGNLIGNAIKFTPEGGTVRLRVQAGDGSVQFAVDDTGPGIPPGDLPHLFEPFWQSKKTAHLGAGLGLKITRAIVEAHGGSIHVSNASGGGASFTFDIPVL